MDETRIDAQLFDLMYLGQSCQLAQISVVEDTSVLDKKQTDYYWSRVDLIVITGLGVRVFAAT